MNLSVICLPKVISLVRLKGGGLVGCTLLCVLYLLKSGQIRQKNNSEFTKIPIGLKICTIVQNIVKTKCQNYP